MRSIFNPNVITMEYAVRGAIPARAQEMTKAGKKVIPCHIGNPQALQQSPLSWFRNVLALVENPAILSYFQKLPASQKIFDSEVEKAALNILKNIPSGTGAYSESKGPAFIRQSIAHFIDRRDQDNHPDFFPADPEKIIMTNGASEGVKHILEILIRDHFDGILIPFPQYPLYSATLQKLDGTILPYYPDADNQWKITREILETSIQDCKKNRISPRAMVIINPSNPIGTVLSLEEMETIIQFCLDKNLLLIADEVYQDNETTGKWASFAKVVGKRPLPLASLHSISKGFCGECGHRGGYIELRHIDSWTEGKISLMGLMEKQASVSLCSNTIGQILVWLMITPPDENTQSGILFKLEKQKILGDLLAKQKLIREGFSLMKGVSCNVSSGSMYLFPCLDSIGGEENDFDYCMNLLETTGLCTVPGRGFGSLLNKKAYMRIAFLPPVEVIKEVVPQWVDFHNRYTEKFSRTSPL